ncbi:ABC transporter substrate-binding protein [Clostridium sp. Marseille-P299]|uniref:ABC transporter substrate-binding protein n=1 Tax=Clostridium sp. Marseille-P299 TaxID=1805477 RepID=UPI000A65F861|nr:ABC transporter substrate-binding protein [Clostridium sp. Marseille-P299]
MRSKTVKKALSLLLVLSLAVGMSACSKKNDNTNNGGNNSGNNSGNEASADTPLVVGYLPFSEKFSPFFASTGYDRDVADMTQVSLLTTDRTGGIIYNSIEGETVAYNGTDYEYKGISDITVDYDETSDITTYNIKIRDDVKFSDGEVLDADDIIFNYYVLADNSYDGSSTLYSTPIIGMLNYRKNNSNAENTTVSAEEIAAEIANMSEETKTAIAEKIIIPTLTSELEWVKTLYGNEQYASYTTEYPVAKDLFANFYSIDESYDSTAVADESQVLSDIIAQYGANYTALGTNYAGDETYYQADVDSIVSEILLDKKLATGGEEVPNIEGIKKISQTEVEVKTKGFDATAIYHICGITVAPLHYYGDESAYDYDNNKFGFTRDDLSIVKAKTTQPMGAGPYKFIKYDNKVVYFEANENYYKGAPKTKYVQFKETQDTEKISGVGTGTIDIADPSGSLAGFEEISSYNSNKEISGDVIETNTVDNLGYGYIGINADNVNVGGDAGSEASKNLRKAFATIFAVYRDVTIDSYYGDAAAVINYPISNTSWAAPQKSDEDYKVAYSTNADGSPIYTSEMSADDKYAAALQAAVDYFVAAGYTYDEASGKLTAAPEGAKLEYEVIIPAGGAGDHPTFAVLTKAKEDLAKIGMTLTINDPSDSNVLWDKTEANTQEMWVAAWSASIDPDMYQVYYSSNRIGKGGTDNNYFAIADTQLDQLILDARQSSDQAYRKATYKSALDIVLDWAVEVPVYQRQNCVIFSAERVNLDTVTPDITTYWGWMNEVEKIEMN